MDNKAIAGILYETADLLEIDAQDSFRIRSYRTAAQAIEALPQQVADLISEPKRLLEVPGIGKGMLLNMQEILKEGRLALHAELLKKYRPSMLELLKIQGLGPKTIALIWSAYQICDIEGVEKLAREGKIRILPRMGEKHEQKLLKAIEDYRRIGGRFLLDAAGQVADKLVEHLSQVDGVDKVTPAGSLRRGRDTIGDLDVLVTGEACVDDACREKLVSRADGDHRARRKQDQLPATQRDAGGCALAAAELFRCGDAVLHRFQVTQRRFAPAGLEDGIHFERIQSCAAR